MLPRDNSAHKTLPHGLEVVLEHPSVGILQEVDALIGRASQQRSQRALDHTDHDALAVVAAPSGRIPKSAREGFSKAAVRLEAALEGRLIQRRPFSDAHECSGE